MKHKHPRTREQNRCDATLVKCALERAYFKSKELTDAMKVADARTPQKDRDRCLVNKDEFKLISEVVEIVIGVLPLLTRLLRHAITHKLGG